MKRVFCACVLLVFAGTCLSADNTVHSPSDARVAHMRQEYDRQVGVVDGWIGKAGQQIALSVAIGVFGLLVGGLQGTTRSWARLLTVSLGLLVSALTLLTKTVYPADSRTLERSGLRARSKLNELFQILENFDPATPMVSQIQVEAAFYTKSGEIDEIGQEILGIDAAPRRSQEKSSNSLLGITTVYAPPKNKGSALPETLLTIVKKSSAATDTWFTYDKATNLYHYFTRLRMTNELRWLDLGELFLTSKTVCGPTKRVEDHELAPFVVGTSDLYVYLAHQSPTSPGRGDVYVFRAGSWAGDRRQIRDGDFRSQLAGMNPAAYVGNTVTNNTPWAFSLGGEHYSIKIVTHPIRRYALITLCAAPAVE